jgi:cytochrome c556
MASSVMRQIFVAALIVAVFGAVGASAAIDVGAILKQRQDTMKQQGKDMGAVSNFLKGKGDLAAAQTAATGLTQTTVKIPDLFPPGTDKPSPDGDYGPKAAIWTDWNKFLDAQKAAASKADALLAAVKTGDKAKIQAAFADLGKNGCGNCHTNFREKLKN